MPFGNVPQRVRPSQSSSKEDCGAWASSTGLAACRDTIVDNSGDRKMPTAGGHRRSAERGRSRPSSLTSNERCYDAIRPRSFQSLHGRGSAAPVPEKGSIVAIEVLWARYAPESRKAGSLLIGSNSNLVVLYLGVQRALGDAKLRGSALDDAACSLQRF